MCTGSEVREHSACLGDRLCSVWLDVGLGEGSEWRRVDRQRGYSLWRVCRDSMGRLELIYPEDSGRTAEVFEEEKGITRSDF